MSKRDPRGPLLDVRAYALTAKKAGNGGSTSAFRIARLAAAVFVLAMLLGCKDEAVRIPPPHNVAEFHAPARSYSGEYQLEVVEHPKDREHAFTFQVSNPSGVVLFRQDEVLFRRRDVNFFLWDEKDRVWAYSGDVGTSIWERDRISPTIWLKTMYVQGAQIAPSYLVEQRPSYFSP